MTELDMEELTVQPELVWEHFTIRDGLPDMKVECIYEDSQGLVWVGTHEGGVACYDGYRFTTYNTENGLAGNGVFSAIEDDTGCMWFGTNRGLSRFDGSEFETHLLDGESRSFLWGRCKDKKGRLWFGLEREPGRDPAICCWDGDSLEQVVLAELDEEEEYLGESINAMDVDEKGQIWCGGSRLYMCDMNKKKKYPRYTITKAKKPYNDNISSIACGNGRTWIGCYNGVVHMYDNEIRYINVEEQVNYVMYANRSDTCYALSGKGGVWSISLDGKSKLISTNSGTLWKGYIGLDEKVIWIGTYGMGFYKLNLDEIYIYKMFNRTGRIVERSKNRLLLLCESRIVIFDTKRNTQSTVILTLSNSVKISKDGVDYRLNDPIVKKSLENVYQDLEDPTPLWSCEVNTKTKDIAIGTIRGHIYVINNKNEVNRVIVTNNKNMRINDLKIGSSGALWYISRYGKGYGVISKAEDKFLSGRVSAIYTDSNGGAYIAEKCENVVQINHIGNSLIKHKTVTEIADVDVLVILSDGNALWLGTSLGLYFIVEGKTVKFTKDDGLSCNIVTSLIKSEDGIIWIGTEGGGVCCFDGKVFQIIPIPNEISYNIVNGIMEDSSNRLWISTEAGLVQCRRNKIRPSVRIVEIGGGKYIKGKSIPRFSSNITSIGFHLKGWSSGENSKDLVYRYRLVGLSKQWKQIKDDTVEFKGLLPGYYVFEVQAVNRYLNYSKVERGKIVVTADPWVSALVADSSKRLNIADQKLNNGKILIIDQDEVFLDYCARFLRDRGFSVTIESTGVDIEESLLHYDVLILNSVEFFKFRDVAKQKSNRLSIKSIIITDCNDLKAIDDIICSGAFTYITKPFEADVLVDKIQEVIYKQKDDLLLYIRSHLKSISTRDDIARILGVSPNTVSNRIRKSCRMGFSEFLQVCRVQEAQKLLVKTNLQIHQIASNTGFESHEGLTRVFKKYTGFTPREYRTKSRSVRL